MGAAHTSIAKPWRREIYLQHEAWPHPVLMHELAHVFAGAFGDSLLHVSRSGMGLNVGLIEGVAVAAAWHGSRLTPHEQAQVMRKAGIAPPLERVLGIGFFRYNGAAAYAEAGSFCRFLLTTRGAAPLEQVYRKGGTEASFLAAYGVPRAQLIAEWGRFVDGLSVPERAQQLAEERLSQPTVFHRVCAHELAARAEQASRASAAGDHARALALYQAIFIDDPDDPDHLFLLMTEARAAQRNAEAGRLAERLLQHPKVSPSLRARAQAMLGDLALLSKDYAGARRAYATAEALPLDEATARLTTVKRITASLASPPEPLVRFVLDEGTDSALRIALLADLIERQPQNGLYQYLWGRQLEQRGLWTRAAEALERSRDRGLPDIRFVREADQLAAICRFREGRLELSRADWQKFAQGAPEGMRLIEEDWLTRIELFDLTNRLANATSTIP
jgi:tetratricopeptide (TPR) repeat protein